RLITAAHYTNACAAPTSRPSANCVPLCGAMIWTRPIATVWTRCSARSSANAKTPGRMANAGDWCSTNADGRTEDRSGAGTYADRPGVEAITNTIRQEVLQTRLRLDITQRNHTIPLTTARTLPVQVTTGKAAVAAMINSLALDDMVQGLAEAVQRPGQTTMGTRPGQIQQLVETNPVGL